MSAHTPRKKGRQRVWVFRLFTLVLTLTVAEGLAQLAYWVLEGSDWIATQEMLAAGGRTPQDSALIVHPFVGAIYDPTAPPDPPVLGDRLQVNWLGYGHPTDPVQKRGPDKYLVAITGGSVAYYLAYYGAPRLLEQLRRLAEVGERDCRIVCLAFPGHKQPQQLMSLAWTQALGAEFDLVINLDGFNEMALSEWNQVRGMSPLFPRDWPLMLPFGLDHEHLVDQFRNWEFRAQRQQLAREIRSSWLRWSALRQLWWRARDTALMAAEVESMQVVSQSQTDELRSFARMGPPVQFASDQEMYDRFAELWFDSSRQMHALAQPVGCHYFHFLQPNQYDPGSKPLSEWELDKAYTPRDEYEKPIVRGYPVLRAAGARLRDQGIAFHDLSRMFEDHPETLYGDPCCHFNQRGNDLLGERIGQVIVEALSQ